MSAARRRGGGGRLIWVTRPRSRAEALCRALSAAGDTPIRLAALRLGPPRDLGALKPILARLDTYQGVIFVSPTAAEGLGRYWPAGRAWPQQARTLAVGRATAAAVVAAGFPPPRLPPSGADSEALLQLPELGAVAGQRLLIVRGNGGREMLAETLCERGAEVDYAETYARSALAELPRELCRLGREGRLDLWTATSTQALDSIINAASADDRAWLRELALVVSAERHKAHAVALGVRGGIRVARGSDDQAMLAAINGFRQVDTRP